MIPDRAIAALRIRAAAMIATTSLVKPEKASFGFTRPSVTPTRSAASDTRS
jgi:hypothetical protein